MTNKQKQGLFSSATDEWATPQDLFDHYDAVYHFNLDPASTDENAKCEKHFTVADDGLHNNWGGVQSVVESALRQEHRGVGAESLRGEPEARHRGGVPPPGEDGHGVVPRLLRQGRDRVYPGSAAVRREPVERAVPQHDCYIWR